ncbi:MAG TPA: coenzyme F430 synthase [Methanocorpusculum sp.]|nr:coenzyme F430 synthase [Methanocorpusculum sp.]
MKVLVLDTIHGGAVLAEALLRHGDDVDAVDVYRGSAMPVSEAKQRGYDLIAAPVHLDPAYPLLGLPVQKITHHQMVRQIFPSCRARIIEITGARGKTSVAYAVCSILPGKTILHTSTGTWVYPEKRLLFRKSITPASLLFAAAAAEKENADWIVAEESLGICGVGELAILTADRDYPIAAGKKSALAAKLSSISACRTVLCPSSCVQPGMHAPEELVRVEGNRFSTAKNGSFVSELADLPVYRNALMTAAAAGVLLDLDISSLADFPGVPGRMCYRETGGVPVLDNANSGTDPDNIAEAFAYLKNRTGKEIILVTGEGDHAVCEGLQEEKIASLVNELDPLEVIRAAGESLEELEKRAVSRAQKTGAAVLLCVKTWR